MNMKLPNKLEFKHISDLPVKVTDWIGSVASIVIHTLFFVGMFTLFFFGYEVGDILLILTTLVSLEAIYLSIFIQMTVNRTTQSLAEVEEDIGEIQEDVSGMEKDIDEIQLDLDKIEEGGKGKKNGEVLDTIETRIQNLMKELEILKQRQHQR